MRASLTERPSAYTPLIHYDFLFLAIVLIIAEQGKRRNRLISALVIVCLGIHTFFEVFGGIIIGVAGYLVLGIAWEKAAEGLKKPFSSVLG